MEGAWEGCREGIALGCLLTEGAKEGAWLGT